jgi:hypothetical protein
MNKLGESNAIGLGKRSALMILFAALMLIVNGCAVQRMYRFTPKSVTRINYDPKHCTQMQDGRIKCKDVVFTVASIDASGNK